MVIESQQYKLVYLWGRWSTFGGPEVTSFENFGNLGVGEELGEEGWLKAKEISRSVLLRGGDGSAALFRRTQEHVSRLRKELEFRWES